MKKVKARRKVKRTVKKEYKPTGISFCRTPEVNGMVPRTPAWKRAEQW